MKYLLASDGTLFYDTQETVPHQTVLPDGKLIEAAVYYALESHSGQFLKNGYTPSALHSLEVMNILKNMGADVRLTAAGVLHAIFSDTNTKESDFSAMFGSDITYLVETVKEDKRLSWKERCDRCALIADNGDRRIGLLVLADKLSELRALMTEFNALGEQIWNRFTSPKEAQHKFYKRVLDALFYLRYAEDTKTFYAEALRLVSELFEEYYTDPRSESIYHISGDVCKVLERKSMIWREVPMPDKLKLVKSSIDNAQMLENYWRRAHRESCMDEAKSGIYMLYSDGVSEFNVWFYKSEMYFAKSGKDTYVLDTTGTEELLYSLHQNHGFDKKIEPIFRKEYGDAAGLENLLCHCAKLKIQVYKKN